MDLFRRAYKYRFYPTEEQKKQLEQTFGCYRFVYNKFLDIKTTAYSENKESIGYNKTSELLTQLKKEESFNWLKDVSSAVLQQSLRNLDRAFDNFFSKRSKYPTFKNKNSKQSIRYVSSAFKFSNGNLKLAKQKDWLDIRWSRRFSGIPTSVTISKDSANRYFVSFAVEETVKKLPKIEKMVGIDVGINDVCVTSDGEKSGAPKYFKKHELKLAKAQKAMARKVKGSQNRKKCRIKVAKIHAKIADSRNDFNNKLTTKIISENQAIAVESLSIKSMIGSQKLAKSILDSSWGDFFRKLKYKIEWYGRDLLEVDRWFPSSKTCFECKHVNSLLKLHMRDWICPCCNSSLDRDVNAARNILAAGQAVLAFGENVRHNIDNSILCCFL